MGVGNRMSNINDSGAQSADELFLIHLRYKEARHMQAGSNQPILLTDLTQSWIVYTGVVDVFVVPLAGNKPNGTRTHLFRAEAGQALFTSTPLDTDHARYGLMAVGGRNASVLRIPSQRL